MRHNHKVLTSSSKHDRQTPEDLLRYVKLIGSIYLDPCTTADNPVGAARYFTKEDDGLRKSWAPARPYKYAQDVVYVNPPYGREISSWVDKAISEAKGDQRARVVLLVPSRTDTVWWQKAYRNADACCLWKGRLCFIDPSEPYKKQPPAPFPVSVFFFARYFASFCDVFEHRGVMI